MPKIWLVVSSRRCSWVVITKQWLVADGLGCLWEVVNGLGWLHYLVMPVYILVLYICWRIFFHSNAASEGKFEFILKKEIDNYIASFLTKSHRGSKFLYRRFHKNLVLQCYCSFKPSFFKPRHDLVDSKKR